MCKWNWYRISWIFFFHFYFDSGKLIAKVLTNAARLDNTQTWETLIGHSILIEFQLKFRINFPYGRCAIFLLLLTNLNTFSYCNSELYDIIMEGHHFECNGFELNPVIRMAIMRKVNHLLLTPIFFFFSKIFSTFLFEFSGNSFRRRRIDRPHDKRLQWNHK